MIKFISGMITFATILSLTLYILNVENNKLKIENDRLQAQQQAYNANTIQAHTSLDALLEQ